MSDILRPPTTVLRQHRPAAASTASARHTSAARDGATRALLACGAVAGPLFLGVVLLQALTRPGFDLRRHPISLLSLGDLGWVQILNFLVSGALVLAFGVGLRRALRGERGGTWSGLLIGAYGVGLIVAGLFVPDAAWGFPLGSPAGIPDHLSWHSALHGLGFMLAFGSVCLACLVCARRWLARGERALAGYAAATAVASLGLAGWPGTDGAAVRYLAAAVLVWTWTSAVAMGEVRRRSPVQR